MHILSPVQLPFLNQQQEENEHRHDFMIDLHESYVAKLEFKLATPGSVSDTLPTVLWSSASQCYIPTRISLKAFLVLEKNFMRFNVYKHGGQLAQ